MDPLHLWGGDPYAYCLGDPVNRVDPSGHFSIFGIHFGWRDFAVMAVGLGVGVLFGVLTGGAGFAIEAGVAISAGVVSDVATGALYDVASGKTPTWQSVGTDALYGAIGGIAGEGIGKALGAGLEVASRGLRGLRSTVDQLLEGAEKLRVAGGELVGFDGRIGSLEHLENDIQRLESRRNLSESATTRLQEMQTQLTEIRARDPWEFDDAYAIASRDPKASKSVAKEYYKFRDLVREQRLDPVIASKELGGSHFERYQGETKEKRCSIRLSKKDRIVFDWEKGSTKLVVKRIIGHYG